MFVEFKRDPFLCLYGVNLILIGILPYFLDDYGFHVYIYDYPELLIPYLFFIIATILLIYLSFGSKWYYKTLSLWTFANILATFGAYIDYDIYRAEEALDTLGYPLYLIMMFGPLSILHWADHRFFRKEKH